ncbi:hypothetical protein ABZ896_11645 [Streptomyces sp. NPDC047072]|uniref:hypothetical protein n=1 Tax=Streptomyces sp. NPDC047072 TaxID=3154809 RepID=UPI0033F78530
MPTHKHLRRLLPATLLAASVLLTGCATGHEATEHAAQHTGSSSPSLHRDPADTQLPRGIAPPGTQQAVGDGAWSVTVQRLERLPAGTAADVPAGSSAYRARLTVTNRRPQIATAPQIAVTWRYGQLGRQATELAGAAAALTGDDPPLVRPNATVRQDVRLVLPDRAQGQPVTVTVEATPQGLAEPDLLFFESALPGRPAAATASQADGSSGSRQDVTPLGQWKAGVRLSSVSVTGTGSVRTARLELSVANGTGDPLPGLGTALRVMTGEDLHPAATIRPVYGYHDAAIAPHRTATQTIAFRVPQSAVGEPVTIEAVDADGSRVTFEGRIG